MLACVFAMAATSCDNDDEPKGPELKFNPANVAVAPGATATATVSGGTGPLHRRVERCKNRYGKSR